MKLYRCLPVLFFIFMAGICSGQVKGGGDGIGIEASLLGGQIFKHTKKIEGPIPEFSKGIDINLIWQTFGKEDWHQGRRFPIIGIGFSAINYGIDSIYGTTYGLYPTITLPLIKNERLEWNLKLGFGVAYNTRHYELAPVLDTLNNAISTHINNFTVFQTHLKYKIDKNISIQAGLQLTHTSNGGFAKPNLGINFVGGNIGLQYFPTTSEPNKIFRNPLHLKSRNLIEFRAGIAFTATGNYGGPVYLAPNPSLYLSRRYLSKNKVFAGIDYSYHPDVYYFLKNNEQVAPGTEAKNSYKSGIFIGNEFLFGRTSILLQAGVYTKQAFLKLDPFYEKLGILYYLVQEEKGGLKELFLIYLLKTHLTQAEFFEFGIGAGF